MTAMDITIPEVRVYTQTAKFFRRGDQDYVEISFVGAKDTLVEKVKPAHMAQFRSEWDAYCDGRPMRRREGTALIELPGLDEDRAAIYVARNVHTIEELAALSDAQCQGIGHGALTDRQGARKLVMKRQLEAREQTQRAVYEASATLGTRPSEICAPTAEIESVKGEIAELKQGIAELAGMVGKSGSSRGRSKAVPKRNEVE